MKLTYFVVASLLVSSPTAKLLAEANHSTSSSAAGPNDNQNKRVTDPNDGVVPVTLTHSTTERKDGTPKKVISSISIQKDGYKVELSTFGLGIGSFVIYNREKEKGLYPKDAAYDAFTEAAKKAFAVEANKNPELKAVLMEMGAIPPDSEFTAQKAKEKLEAEKVQREKESQVAKVVSKHSEVLQKLFKLEGEKYVVRDDSLETIKTDFAGLVGIKAENLTFLSQLPKATEANARVNHQGTTFFGDTLIFIDNESQSLYLADTSGHLQKIDKSPTLMALHGSSVVTLEQTYDSEKGTVETRGFLGATPLTISSFEMMRDGGSITSVVIKPDGESLFITRKRGDDSTIRITSSRRP